jgi:hypothetical protein
MVPGSTTISYLTLSSALDEDAGEVELQPVTTERRELPAL